MINIRCYYRDGDTVNTMFNGTMIEAEKYFVGNIFNIESVDDNMQKCYKVELLGS